MISHKTGLSARKLFPILLCLMLPFSGSWAYASSETSDDTEAEELYIENQWNYVEGSMDISEGIPADAEGQLGKIREAGKLVVATEPYYAPQEFIDSSLSGQDQYVGSDMELAKLIAEKMGVELEIVPMEFTKVLTAPAEGLCDLAISGLAYTPGRAASLELSKGYFFAPDSAGTGILIRQDDAEELIDTDQLSEKNLIAQSGSLQELLLAENVTQYGQFFRVSSMQEVYDAVQDGTADAAAVDIETAEVYIKSNPDCGLAIMENVRFKLDEQYEGDRIAAKKGELQLMYFVNGVIDEVLENDQYRTWFDEFTEYAANLGLS